MAVVSTPPTEDIVSAYLDDELPPKERRKVVAWLLENSDAAKEVMEMRLRDEMLKLSMDADYFQKIEHHNSGKTYREPIIASWRSFIIGFVVAAIILKALF